MSFSLSGSLLASALTGDPEIEALFAVEAEIAAMLRFEAALAEAQARFGLIPAAAADAIVVACGGFSPDLHSLAAGIARDGVVVPEFVKQLRAAVGEPHAINVHHGATSQDVVDTALVLRLAQVCSLLQHRLEGLVAALDDLLARFGEAPLMGRTRMQAAIPITAGDRIRAWRAPLPRHLERLSELKPRLLRVQLGGAAGTLEKMDGKGGDVTVAMADELGLAISPQWHTDRSSLAEFASWLALVAGSLGKFGQDVALMAQNELAEIAISGAGGSSAMPHKQNPVKAETLVALARHCAILAGGMQQTLVHEQERSGAAWTLEWLLLPQLCVASGAAARVASELAGSIGRIGGA